MEGTLAAAGRDFSSLMMSGLRGSWRSGCRLRAVAGLLALAFFAAPIMGCSLFNKEDDYVPEDPADKLYNEGLFLLNNKQDYTGAAKKFDEVDRQNPYSD
jgi:outer membrane protein assembly factor BamD